MKIEISNKEIENLLKEYYKEKYKSEWDEINVYVSKHKYSEPDGWGFYDDYYELKAYVTLKKKRRLLNKEYVATDVRYLKEEEIRDIMSEMVKKDGYKLNKILSDDDNDISILIIEELEQQYQLKRVPQRN